MRKERKMMENKMNQKNDKISKIMVLWYFELIFQNLIYYSVNNYKSKTIILIIIIFLD